MFIERLKIAGLLSFGPYDAIDLPLEPLNVLIGPNGSGKSNLLSALGILRATTGDLNQHLSSLGEMHDLVWKGPPPFRHFPTGTRSLIAATVALPHGSGTLHHSLYMDLDAKPLMLREESIDYDDKSGKVPEELYNSLISSLPEEFDKSQSVISQVENLPDEWAFRYLQRGYTAMRLYRDWTFGAGAPARCGQSAALSNIALHENAGNLAPVIERLSYSVREKLTHHLNRLYEGIEGIHTQAFDDKIWVAVLENGGRQIPAAHLSDGTLRYLSLLTVLLDPNPPPLIAIEEPELGLHPDVVFGLAPLLVEASTRTQLVVTTHSPTLIDALTDYPSSVVACDKYDGQTRFRRVNPEDLASWIGDRGLGEVWADGGIGGNRW